MSDSIGPMRRCYLCNKSPARIQVLPGMAAYFCADCAHVRGARAIDWSEIDNSRMAPWSSHQIASLNGYQGSATFLPFVCDQQHVLVALEDGLRCSQCNCEQRVTYDWTLNWTWKLLEPPLGDGVPARNTPDGPVQDAAISLEEPEVDDEE